MANKKTSAGKKSTSGTKKIQIQGLNQHQLKQINLLIMRIL